MAYLKRASSYCFNNQDWVQETDRVQWRMPQASNKISEALRKISFFKHARLKDRLQFYRQTI